MRAISISNDIVPIAEFKTNISKWFKTLQTSRHPLIITQNSKPAGVLLSASDYDELVYRKSFLDSVEKGFADVESGRIQTTDELRKALRARPFGDRVRHGRPAGGGVALGQQYFFKAFKHDFRFSFKVQEIAKKPP